MRLTRRGWVVIAVVGFCFVMALEYGARSLNALVAPLFVAVVAAAITVSRAESPEVRRHSIEEGFVGETRTVTVSLETDSPIAGVVTDTVEEGLETIVRSDGGDSNADDGGVVVTADDDGDAVGSLTIAEGSGFSYDVRLAGRGERTVGPASITVRDVLGLVERDFEDDTTESVLVYPEVYDLHGASRHDLQTLADAIRQYNREEFDRLREYERGDSLRDVHWKSTAKRTDEELVVKEFVADEDLGAVDIVAESTAGHDDEMATAAASVATYLLEMGVSVAVTVPNGSCPSRTGRDHHLTVLRLLARATHGQPAGQTSADADADILIRADEHGTTVVIDDQEIPFARLRQGVVRTTITDTDPTGGGPGYGPSGVAA